MTGCWAPGSASRRSMRCGGVCRGSRAVDWLSLPVRRPGLALMISDVPGDDPAVIGSGLLHRSRGRNALPRTAARRSRRRARALSRSRARGGAKDRCAHRRIESPRQGGGAPPRTHAADGSRCAPGAANSRVTRPISVVAFARRVAAASSGTVCGLGWRIDGRPACQPGPRRTEPAACARSRAGDGR